MPDNKKIAVVSDKLTGAIGGAESIVFALLDLYSDTPVYTTILDERIIPKKYSGIDYHTSFIQKLPLAKKYYKAYFPLMPFGIEALNMQEYDIIFSSHHCVAKGVIPRPDAIHMCYCHSPARYIWDMFWTYSKLNKLNPIKRLIISAISQHIRMWDVTSSNRVDHFLANSSYTASRIKKYYNRNAEIFYPPVETEKFCYQEEEDYYLMAGRLVAYKGFEQAIEAFNASGKPLVIIGNGAEYKKLKAMAKPNIQMLGHVSEKDLIYHFNHCKAFVYSGKEDFGIVMAEAQAAGKPVIALNGGGALDIVINKETGVLFDKSDTESINKAIKLAEEIQWDHKLITNHSKQFDISIFKNRLQDLIENADKYRMK